MAVKVYVLIEAEIGKAGDVVKSVQKIKGISAADGVTGPYDVVATFEMSELNVLGNLVKQIHAIPGIRKTTSLVAVKM
ncbi:MAG: Lrp/AsnC ligand binding domain-containing protein [Chloroflexota bacterium]